MSLTPDEEAGWVEALDRLHTRLTELPPSTDPQTTLCLLAHAVGGLCRLEADRMRVSADPADPAQLHLFDSGGASDS